MIDRNRHSISKMLPGCSQCQRHGLMEARGDAPGIVMKIIQALKGRIKQFRAARNESPLQGLGFLFFYTRGVAPGYNESGRWPSKPIAAFGIVCLLAPLLLTGGCRDGAAARQSKGAWNVTDHIALKDFVVQAHRGAGDLAEEGTLEAFKLGWSLGTIPEADIRATKDGVIVSFHDSNFSRLVKDADAALKKSSVEKSTWEFLQTLDVGAWKGEEFRGRRTAKMADIFAHMAANPGLRLYMDIKKVDFAKLAALVRAAGVGDRVIVASRYPDELVEWKKHVPESGTLLWMPQKSAEVMELIETLVADGRIKSITSVQLHVHPNPNYKNHNPAHSYNTGWKNNAPDAGAEEPFNHPREFIARLGARLRELGVPYQAFPYSRDPAVYGALMDLGVASFATDRPDVAMREVRAYYAAAGTAAEIPNSKIPNSNKIPNSKIPNSNKIPNSK